MKRFALQAGGLFAIVERDFRVFISYRTQAVTQLAGVVMTMAIFYYVAQLIEIGQFKSADEYFAFVTAGLLIVLVLQSAVGTPSLVRQELAVGTFERILASPFGAVAGLIGMMLFPILFSCVLAAVGFVLASLIFTLPVQWASAPAALPVALLGASAFAAIGIFVMAGVVVFKQSLGVTWVLALLSLTGGVYFPVTLLPGSLEWFSGIQPFTPTMDLLRHLLLGTDAAGPAGPALLKLVGFVVILTPLSALVLRAAIQIGRRRGTILEY